MSTLWIFGDSFSFDYTLSDNHAVLEGQWHRLLARELELNVVNTSMNGASMDWIYYQMDLMRDPIQGGDTVIAMATNTSRRWLIKDRPSCSTIKSLESFYSKTIDPKLRKAMRNYFIFLHHYTYEPALFRNWLYSLDSLVRDRGVRVLLLPCFDDTVKLLRKEQHNFPRLSIAQGGHLFDISEREHVLALRGKMFRDGRCNHFVPSNHRVLTDKIIAWYKDDTLVDLSHGFHEDLIDGSDLRSSEFFATEHVLR